MHILLVEPSSTRRKNLTLILTTTGGFRVTATSALPDAQQQCRADLLVVRQPVFQRDKINIPCILFDASPRLHSKSPVIGIVPQGTDDIALAEKVRILWRSR